MIHIKFNSFKDLSSDVIIEIIVFECLLFNIQKNLKNNVKKTIDKEQKKLVPASDKDIDFIKTTMSNDVDDDGYEEGKSKEREISADDLPMSKEGGPEYRDPSGKKITLREFEKAMKNESKKKK